MFDCGHASEQIVKLRKEYPAGQRIELVYTDDPYTRLTYGSRGTVVDVDDIGTVHIDWDDGSRLGLICGIDSFIKI